MKTYLHGVTAIKKAVDEGQKVYADTKAYVVVKDSIEQYLIKCLFNSYCIGLTWADGITLNGTNFYTKPEQ